MSPVVTEKSQVDKSQVNKSPSHSNKKSLSHRVTKPTSPPFHSEQTPSSNSAKAEGTPSGND